jgi:hypothetical protein
MQAAPAAGFTGTAAGDEDPRGSTGALLPSLRARVSIVVAGLLQARPCTGSQRFHGPDCCLPSVRPQRPFGPSSMRLQCCLNCPRLCRRPSQVNGWFGGAAPLLLAMLPWTP